jgi:hypothetical protein
MNIPAFQIPPYIPEETYQFSLRAASGQPFRICSREELLVLIEENRVRACVRGSRLDYLYLTVPPDVAARDLGESRQRVKDALHSDANKTTLRAGKHVWHRMRRHNNAMIFGRHPSGYGWNGPSFFRERKPRDVFIVDSSRLTLRERAELVSSYHGPLRPPLATKEQMPAASISKAFDQLRSTKKEC